MNISIQEIEKIKEHLKQCNIPDEQIDELLKTFDVFYELSDFLQKKLNLSQEEIQDLSNGYTKREIENRKEEIEKMDLSGMAIYELTGDIMVQFAEKYDFPNPGRIKYSLLECIKIIGM